MLRTQMHVLTWSDWFQVLWCLCVCVRERDSFTAFAIQNFEMHSLQKGTLLLEGIQYIHVKELEMMQQL